MTSLRSACRAVITAVLALGLVLGMSALVAPASAEPTAVPTASSTSEQCLEARNAAAAARQASVAAATRVAVAKRKAVRATKKLRKVKKGLVRTKKAVLAGKAKPRAQKKAQRKVTRVKRVVKRKRAVLRKRKSVATVRRDAAVRAAAASVAACAAQPGTPEEVDPEETAAEAEESIVVAEDLAGGEHRSFALLPAQLTAPLQETFGAILAQLIELESLIPAAGPAELQTIAGQLTALDPDRFVSSLDDLADTLSAVAGDGSLPGGPAELVALLEALLAQADTPAGLPPGGDLTVITSVVADAVAAIQGFDPTGHSASLDGLAGMLDRAASTLQGGASELSGVVALLGALAGGVEASALQQLLGSLVQAIGGGSLPSAGDLPFVVPTDAIGADQAAVLLTTLTSLLGGDALPADGLANLVEDILGGIPGLPGLVELPGLDPVLDPILGPILDPVLCGIPLLCS